MSGNANASGAAVLRRYRDSRRNPWRVDVLGSFLTGALYDKVYGEDILAHAYGLCRSNGGAPGAGGMTFDMIESAGCEEWPVARLLHVRTEGGMEREVATA